VRLTPGGRLVAQNATLQQLITTAYQIRDFQLFGGPSWLTSEHFDIEAKPSGKPTADQVSGMLQVLLADRFGLVIHHETKEVSVYRLVVAKRGSSLSPSRKICNQQSRQDKQAESKLPGDVADKGEANDRNQASGRSRKAFFQSGSQPSQVTKSRITDHGRRECLHL